MRHWPWFAAGVSGLLLAACFPPFDQGWLVWIALTPLICAATWPSATPRPFRYGLLAGVLYFAGSFHWLATLGLLFASPALYALPLLLGLYLGLYVGLWARFLPTLVGMVAAPGFASSSRNLVLGALAAFTWVALEWFRSWFLSGFGWNTLAVATRHELPLIQLAAFTGGHGLSWLVVFVNVMAVVIVRRLLGELGPAFLQRVRWEFSVTMALIAVIFSFGVRALFAQPLPSIPLRVAAVQPNIPQEIKFAGPEEEDRVFATLSRHTLLAASAQPAPQLVLWPESATPRGVFADELNQQFVRHEAARGEYGLMFGSLEGELDPADSENELIYNSAVLLTGRGAHTQIFRKMHLVIFGEYLPLRPYMPAAIAALIPGDLAAGHDFTVLDLPAPAVKIGALVCFEDTVPEVARGLVQGGAQVLVNLTNDGWFLHSAAVEQHLANAILRAVEFRRPLLRCANTGVTGVVDPFGRVDRWVGDFEEGVGFGAVAVPQAPALSFYARHGEWFAHLSAVIACLAALRAGLRRRARAPL